MDLVIPLSLAPAGSPPAPLALTSLAAVIASVRLIAAAELRLLLLYQGIERYGLERDGATLAPRGSTAASNK